MDKTVNNPILRMDLPTGTVLIECFPDIAPNHVRQILELASKGHYDGTIFHRVIHNFMAQGGDGPKPLPQLTAEFNNYAHTEGVCSMARTNDPNSASDQFFICLADARFLDWNYTVWGKVIFGMSNVHAIEKGEPPAFPTPIVRMRPMILELGNFKTV